MKKFLFLLLCCIFLIAASGAASAANSNTDYVVEMAQIAQGINNPFNAAIEPNGRIALCAKPDDTTYQILLIDPNTGESKRVSDSNYNATSQRFSRDGKFLVYNQNSGSGGKSRVIIYNTEKDITFGFGDANDPNQTFPDAYGNKFTFTSYVSPGNSDIWGGVINADGNGVDFLFQICSDVKFQYHSFMADGNHVAWEDLRVGREIYLADITDPFSPIAIQLTSGPGEKIIGDAGRTPDNVLRVGYSLLSGSEWGAYIISESGSTVTLSAENGIVETTQSLSHWLALYTKDLGGLYLENGFNGDTIPVATGLGEIKWAQIADNVFVFSEEYGSNQYRVYTGRIFAAGDINRDGVVDFRDFAILARQWLLRLIFQD